MENGGHSKLTDGELEEQLRERAFEADCELRVESKPTGWRAAFQQYNSGIPTRLAPNGISRLAGEGESRREALLALTRVEAERRTRERRR